MRILGIETSCDETAAAIVKDGTKILSNVVTSSIIIHQKTGGIIPESAAREQIKWIIPVINKAMADGKWTMDKIDAIAVTIGPGLIGSLLVGIETAKTLSFIFKKKIVPVNHILAHSYANWLIPEIPSTKHQILNKFPISNFQFPKFPLITLVVSGGHTELFLMKKHGDIKWLGGTRDDAAGEAFDKIARLLGLGYPGGPAIAATAAKFKIQNSKFKILLPRPMIDDESFDFSFSGLKTAVLREVKKLKSNSQFDNLIIRQLAYEVQEAITDVLVAKTLRAAEKHQIRSILIGGGVAANDRLREKMKFAIRKLDNSQLKLFVPEKKFCTDNAAYVASYTFFNFKPVPWQKISPKPELLI